MATFFAHNILFLRNQLKEKTSQQKLADLLGIKKSTLAAYEAGRAEPCYADLVRLATFFDVTLDHLLTLQLNPFNIKQKISEKVLVATVDKLGNDNIEFVPVRALGGYAEGYGDIDYVQQLPSFQLPFLSKQRKYRAFPYEGDSMPPLREGAIVFGEYIDYWKGIKNGTICLIVTKDEGVVLKKVFNYLEEKNVLILKSLNERYAPYPIKEDEILEIWRFVGYFDEKFPE